MPWVWAICPRKRLCHFGQDATVVTHFVSAVAFAPYETVTPRGHMPAGRGKSWPRRSTKRSAVTPVAVVWTNAVRVPPFLALQERSRATVAGIAMFRAPACRPIFFGTRERTGSATVTSSSRTRSCGASLHDPKGLYAPFNAAVWPCGTCWMGWVPRRQPPGSTMLTPRPFGGRSRRESAHRHLHLS